MARSEAADEFVPLIVRATKLVVHIGRAIAHDSIGAMDRALESAEDFGESLVEWLEDH